MNDQLAHDGERTQTTWLRVKANVFILSHHPQHLNKAGVLFW